MLEVSYLHFVILGTVALMGGILSAMTGGAALVMIPALLMTGMPPHLALGTNKLFTTASLSTSAIYFIRKRLVDPKIWLAMMISTLFGTLLGASLAIMIPSTYLSLILPICFIILTLYFLHPNSWQHQPQQSSWQQSKLIHTLTSSCLGLYSGFIGAGSGSIWMSVAMRIFKLEAREASAMTRVMAFISNACALIIFMLMQQVDYWVGGMLVIGGCLGARIGVKLVAKYGITLIKPVITASTGLMAIKLAYDAWL